MNKKVTTHLPERGERFNEMQKDYYNNEPLENTPMRIINGLSFSLGEDLIIFQGLIRKLDLSTLEREIVSKHLTEIIDIVGDIEIHSEDK